MDNKDNIFVNLPHIILCNIIYFVDKNIDRVFFSLTCKKWYNERIKYLHFKNILIDYSPKTIPFNLHTFLSVIHKSTSSYTPLTDLTIQEKEENSQIFLNSFPIPIHFLNYYLITYKDVIGGKIDIPKTCINLFTSYYFQSDYQPLMKNLEGSNIKTIRFNYGFEQVIQPNTIPDQITSMVFDGHYNKPLQIGSLPPKLEVLSICGHHYSHVLPRGIFPDSLTYLSLSSINQDLEELILPPNLTHLTLPYKYNQKMPATFLPNRQLQTIKYLNIQDLSCLPPTVSNLELVSYPVSSELIPGNIPQTVTNLTLMSYEFPLKPGAIPSSIKILNLYGYNKQLEMNVLPTSLEYLDFGNLYDHPIEPTELLQPLVNLKTLIFSNYFNQPLVVGSIPGVESLTLKYEFNSKIDVGAIPSTVSDLIYLSPSTQLYREPDIIPPSVKKLDLFHHPLHATAIPNFIDTVIVRCRLARPITPNLNVNNYRLKLIDEFHIKRIGYNKMTNEIDYFVMCDDSHTQFNGGFTTSEFFKSFYYDRYHSTNRIVNNPTYNRAMLPSS